MPWNWWESQLLTLKFSGFCKTKKSKMDIWYTWIKFVVFFYAFTTWATSEAMVNGAQKRKVGIHHPSRGERRSKTVQPPLSHKAGYQIPIEIRDHEQYGMAYHIISWCGLPKLLDITVIIIGYHCHNWILIEQSSNNELVWPTQKNIAEARKKHLARKKRTECSACSLNGWCSHSPRCQLKFRGCERQTCQ